MTINDISTGHDWILWVTLAGLAILSAILLSGHGANLIAGYNTLSKEKKAEYNEKKLCQVIGTGMLAATVATLVIELGKSVLSAWVIYIYIGFVILDCVVMIILAQKICKK